MTSFQRRMMVGGLAYAAAGLAVATTGLVLERRRRATGSPSSFLPATDPVVFTLTAAFWPATVYDLLTSKSGTPGFPTTR